MIETRIRVVADPMWGDVRIYHYTKNLDDGSITVAHSPQAKVITRGEQAEMHPMEDRPHLLKIHRQDPCLQRMMDDLWELGVRPTEGHGSTGQLAATEAHLNTMKAIVDRLLITSNTVSVTSQR